MDDAKTRDTRVGGAVYQRRAELGLTQEELAAKADVSRVTVDAIENGRTGQTPRRNPSYPKLERALGWPPGRIRAIMTGDDPDERGRENAPFRSGATFYEREAQLDAEEAELTADMGRIARRLQDIRAEKERNRGHRSA